MLLLIHHTRHKCSYIFNCWWPTATPTRTRDEKPERGCRWFRASVRLRRELRCCCLKSLRASTRNKISQRSPCFAKTQLQTDVRCRICREVKWPLACRKNSFAQSSFPSSSMYIVSVDKVPPPMCSFSVDVSRICMWKEKGVSTTEICALQECRPTNLDPRKCPHGVEDKHLECWKYDVAAVQDHKRRKMVCNTRSRRNTSP